MKAIFYILQVSIKNEQLYKIQNMEERARDRNAASFIAQCSWLFIGAHYRCAFSSEMDACRCRMTL